MRVRGPNNDERAVQTGCVTLRVPRKKKKCRELLAQKLTQQCWELLRPFARSLKNLVFPIMYLWMSCNI